MSQLLYFWLLDTSCCTLPCCRKLFFASRIFFTRSQPCCCWLNLRSPFVWRKTRPCNEPVISRTGIYPVRLIPPRHSAWPRRCSSASILWLRGLMAGARHGGDAGHHADDRHEHCARVREQQRAADDKRGDAGECHQTMPIPSHQPHHRQCSLKFD